jgi:hypothetical protein
MLAAAAQHSTPLKQACHASDAGIQIRQCISTTSLGGAAVLAALQLTLPIARLTRMRARAAVLVDGNSKLACQERI